MDLEDILAQHGLDHDLNPVNVTKEETPVIRPERKAPEKKRKESKGTESTVSSFVTIRIPREVSDNLHRLQTALLVSTGRKESLGDLISDFISEAGRLYGSEVERTLRRLK